MPKPRMAYFEEDDVLHLTISEEPEARSVELAPNITAELDAAGELVGMEILDASTYLWDSILGSVRAKMLPLAGHEATPPRFEVEPHSFGLEPGIDPDRMNRLADELEAEEAGRKLGR